MDNAIPSLLIGALLLVAGAFMARSGIQSYEKLGVSAQAMQARASERTGTQLAITGTSLDAARDTITLSVRNDGQTRIARFDLVDVIVTYYTSATARTTAWLAYEEAVTANSWTVLSISDDTYEPGILNPGETAQIQVELGSSIEPGKTNLIVVGSESGTTISTPFSS